MALAHDFNISYLRIIQLTIPVMLSNMTVTFSGIVDIAFLGHYGNAFMIGGLTLSVAILTVILGSFNFLRAVGTGFFAQSYGENHPLKMIRHLIRLLTLAVTFGILIALFNPIIYHFCLWLLAPNPSMQSPFQEYLCLRLYGVIFVFVHYVLIGWLMAIQKMNAVFIIQIGTTISNIILNYYFIVIKDWDVWGAALGTVIADMLGMILCIFFIFRTRPFSFSIKKSIFNALWHKTYMINITHHSANFILRTFLLSSTLLFFTKTSESFGVNQFAANTIIWQIFMMTVYLLDGFAYVAESLCANAYGAKKYTLLKHIIFRISVSSYICAIFVGIGLWFFTDDIVTFMTKDTVIISLAHESVLWLSLLPAVSLGCFLLDGIYIGLLQTHIMRNYLIISFMIYALIHNILITQFNIAGLWLGLMAFFLARSVAAIHLTHFFKKSEHPTQ